MSNNTFPTEETTLFNIKILKRGLHFAEDHLQYYLTSL